VRILVLGSGAREHALTWKLGHEPGVDSVVCAPGNAGIARSLDTAALDPLNIDAVVAFVRERTIDLTVVGPEAPLARGLADRLNAEGLAVFGPTAAAAQLETSKAFAKDFMQRHGVPTARYRVCTYVEDALEAIRSGEFGDALVVKADGLAAGKGVVVAPDWKIAEAAVEEAMVNRAYGDAGARVVLEELLTGPEVSFFVVANGEQFVPLLSAQDHKRIFDNDQGPNTGGMGAFSPSPLMTPDLQQRVIREIVRPVLSGMVAEGNPFRGFLYCGLMITNDGPKVIEFNVRFGDPEAQVVLPLLDKPLAPILSGVGSRESGVDRSRQVSVGVVLAAHGYPGDVRTGDVIRGLDTVPDDVLVFFAGVKEKDGQLVSSGGRVMTVVARDNDFKPAIDRAYAAASRIHFDGMQYRRDIGRKALG
jgi:phosphoribosylamine--glycine ligase